MIMYNSTSSLSSSWFIFFHVLMPSNSVYTKRKQKLLTNLNYMDFLVQRESQRKMNRDVVTILIGMSRKIFRNENWNLAANRSNFFFFKKKFKVKTNHLDNRAFIKAKVDFEKNISCFVSELVSGAVNSHLVQYYSKHLVVSQMMQFNCKG